MTTLGVALSGIHSAQVRLDASAHNVANLTTEGFRPARAVQAELAQGGATARIDRAPSERPVDLVRETVEISRASLQYTASLRLFAVEADLRGQLANLLA